MISMLKRLSRPEVEQRCSGELIGKCIKFANLLLGAFDAFGSYIDSMVEHPPLSRLQAFELLEQAGALIGCFAS